MAKEALGERIGHHESLARRERIIATAKGLSRFALLGMLVHGCVFDADDRCSPGQVFLPEFGLCVCADGSALTDQGCVPCGENESVGSSGCVCAEGFSRPSEGAPCQAAPSTLGVACDTVSAPCADTAYDVCFASEGTAGYCTKECTGDEDCAGGYACDTLASPPYCRRPPTGAGRACASPADCAGYDASFCESFMLHQCVVGCSTAAGDCFPGTQCCDFTMFGAPAPFCLPAGAC